MPIEGKQLVESFRELVTRASLCEQQRPVCLHCGATRQYRELNFQVYGTDQAWSIRVPFCDCEERATVPHGHETGETSTALGHESEGTALAPEALEKKALRSIGLPHFAKGPEWRELYTAAVFERDKCRMSERIAHAEWALLLRARELFYAGGGDYSQEQQALEAAMYALNVLKSHDKMARGNGGMTKINAA